VAEAAGERARREHDRELGAEPGSGRRGGTTEGTAAEEGRERGRERDRPQAIDCRALRPVAALEHCAVLALAQVGAKGSSLAARELALVQA
jgi:hypothetical protein